MSVCWDGKLDPDCKISVCWDTTDIRKTFERLKLPQVVDETTADQLLQGRGRLKREFAIRGTPTAVAAAAGRLTEVSDFCGSCMDVIDSSMLFGHAGTRAQKVEAAVVVATGKVVPSLKKWRQ